LPALCARALQTRDARHQTARGKTQTRPDASQDSEEEEEEEEEYVCMGRDRKKTKQRP
jgi:hypothetical protein